MWPEVNDCLAFFSDLLAGSIIVLCIVGDNSLDMPVQLEKDDHIFTKIGITADQWVLAMCWHWYLEYSTLISRVLYSDI